MLLGDIRYKGIVDPAVFLGIGIMTAFLQPALFAVAPDDPIFDIVLIVVAFCDLFRHRSIHSGIIIGMNNILKIAVGRLFEFFPITAVKNLYRRLIRVNITPWLVRFIDK